jgi:ABC-type transport system involved in multi-copper enzyme maturation permease subunit
MKVIGHVAVNVFKESVRDKVLYNLVVFAVLLMSASYLIGELTAGQDVKIIKDLGLASISVFGLLIAVFIGIGLVWKEVEKRSVYTLLSKPMRRQEFLLGKYFGLVLTLIINVAVMTAAYYVVLAYMQAISPPNLRASWPAPATDPALLKAIALIVLELMLVTAIA